MSKKLRLEKWTSTKFALGARKRVNEQRRTYALYCASSLIRPKRHNIVIGFGKVPYLVLPHMCGSGSEQ